MMLLNDHQTEQSNAAGASGLDKQHDEEGMNEPNTGRKHDQQSKSGGMQGGLGGQASMNEQEFMHQQEQQQQMMNQANGPPFNQRGFLEFGQQQASRGFQIPPQMLPQMTHQQQQFFIMQQQLANQAQGGHSMAPDYGASMHGGPGQGNLPHGFPSGQPFDQNQFDQQAFMLQQIAAAQERQSQLQGGQVPQGEQAMQQNLNHLQGIQMSSQGGTQAVTDQQQLKDGQVDPSRPIVPLETNKEQGVILVRESNGGDADIYWSQFSPTQRMLFMGGNYDKPSLWDLRHDNADLFKRFDTLPHMQANSSEHLPEGVTDVSSVHWNQKGDRIVTSSSDCYARVWKVEEGSPQTEEKQSMVTIKPFKFMLMQSKFNKGAGDLIASGGHSSVVSVWNSENSKNVVSFNLQDIDEGFACRELEWQDPKTLAVSGQSKNIYLWSVDQPDRPVQIWSYQHHNDIKQIQWDPSGNHLASCSNDPYACIWHKSRTQPVQTFSDLEANFNCVRWSNGSSSALSQQDPMLAAGGQDGYIRIWNVNKQETLHQLNHGAKEGVNALAFSPNNKMIASGGDDNIIIWQLNQDARNDFTTLIMRHFQRKPTATQVQQQMLGTTGSITGGASGGALHNGGFGQAENPSPPKSVYEISWSHDGMLLAAAIDDATAIFDIRKLSQPLAQQ